MIANAIPLPKGNQIMITYLIIRCIAAIYIPLTIQGLNHV